MNSRDCEKESVQKEWEAKNMTQKYKCKKSNQKLFL